MGAGAASVGPLLLDTDQGPWFMSGLLCATLLTHGLSNARGCRAFPSIYEMLRFALLTPVHLGAHIEAAAPRRHP